MQILWVKMRISSYYILYVSMIQIAAFSSVWMPIFMDSVRNKLAPGVAEAAKKVWDYKESKHAERDDFINHYFHGKCD